jgi:1-deoxy-D-xylulose-5-phosphate synthase
MTLLAPRDEKSMHQALGFAASYDHPCALRYPRGSFMDADLPESTPFELGRSQLLVSNESDILFIGYGNGVGRAAQTMTHMDQEVSLLDLRFVKPLDGEMLRDLATKHTKWFIFSDSAKMGGVGSAVLEFLADEAIMNVQVRSFEYSDAFITHGKTAKVEESLGLLPEQLAVRVKDFLA